MIRLILTVSFLFLLYMLVAPSVEPIPHELEAAALREISAWSIANDR